MALDVVARTVTSDQGYVEPKVLSQQWLDVTGSRVCTVGHGTPVVLHTTVQGYRDGLFEVPILEVDPFDPDDLVTTLQMQIVDGVGTASWTAQWQSDGWLGLGGDPEMKFVVQGVDSPHN